MYFLKKEYNFNLLDFSFPLQAVWTDNYYSNGKYISKWKNLHSAKQIRLIRRGSLWDGSIHIPEARTFLKVKFGVSWKAFSKALGIRHSSVRQMPSRDSEGEQWTQTWNWKWTEDSEAILSCFSVIYCHVLSGWGSCRPKLTSLDLNPDSSWLWQGPSDLGHCLLLPCRKLESGRELGLDSATAIEQGG